MSEDDEKTIHPNHDRAVRAIALENAVEVAIAGLGRSATPEGIIAMAEVFRAFLAVPGTPGDHVIMSGDLVRGMLSPSSTVVLPAAVTMPPAPAPASDALADELRAFRQFIERAVAEERAGPGDKAA